MTEEHLDEARTLVQRSLRLLRGEVADVACPLPDGVEEPTLALVPVEE